MAFDRDFAEALISVMHLSGWTATLPDGELPNPLTLVFSGSAGLRRLIIHAQRVTAQARSGPQPSDHHRPAGEMHAQLIFDGDQRGAGNKHRLRYEDGAETVLFGFCPIENDYVVAAYDPERHREYGYSSSLQVKRQILEQAFKLGFVFQPRKNGETIVVFRLDGIGEYLDNASDFHDLRPVFVDEVVKHGNSSRSVRQILDPTLNPDQLPELMPAERKKAIAELERYVRDHRFSEAIRSVYDRCAICGFQYDFILDAAHIIPVSEGGQDTYENGLGLCPNCHRMFDKGLILIDEHGVIHINTRYAEEYDEIGRADSLGTLRTTLDGASLRLPQDKKYHPSPENLRQTFRAKRD